MTALPPLPRRSLRKRLALSYAILLPPIFVLVFVGIMVIEANHTEFTRLFFFVAQK